MVGSMVGKTLKQNAIIAIILSLIGIIIYIWIRFNFVFGIAATIATFHDVIRHARSLFHTGQGDEHPFYHRSLDHCRVFPYRYGCCFRQDTGEHGKNEE